MKFVIITIAIIASITGASHLQLVFAQLNECTIFDGRIFVVVRASNDCLGYADAKMADEGWTIIGFTNTTLFMEKPK